MKRGTVVLCRVPMPSIELREFKLRPAVVVSNDKNNERLDDVMIAPCTSNIKRRREPTHIIIEGKEIETTGIVIPSVVRCESLLTISKSMIIKSLGKLSPKAMKDLSSCLMIALQIED